MSDTLNNRRKYLTPTNIAASAFNLPIMVIAGVFVGSLLSTGFKSPGKELIIIISVIVFFSLAIFEIYLVIQYQARKEFRKTLQPQRTLSRLILESSDEEDEIT
ncbi:MAG: hypothetical protein ACXACP_06350 [Candidatus Hodarchaeales archaeon]|jgi:hypothetical protein